jgi:hypothetical protein
MSVFNGERFLSEAIESILNQTFRDFEFIIINDGSRDGTAPILESHQKRDPRLHVFTQENKGLIASLNRGCGLARGRYIARMDADDMSLPDRLERQVRFMDDHDNVGLLGGAVQVIDDQGSRLQLVHPPQDDETIRSALRSFSFPIFHPAVVMRKQAFDAAGGYRTQFMHAEDYDLWLRIIEGWKVANLPAVVLRKRVHAAGVSVHNLRQQSLSALAAQALASIRAQQGVEPRCDEPAISAVFVEKLGISPAMQRQHLISAYLSWIGVMSEASQHEAVLQLFEELKTLSRPDPVPRPVVSKAMLSAYWVHSRQGRPVRALVSLAKALWAGAAGARRSPERKKPSSFGRLGGGQVRA